MSVIDDESEAPYVYGYLCDLIQDENSTVLGVKNSNWPRIVAIIAEAFHHDVIKPEHEVGRRMLAIVKQIDVSPDEFCTWLTTDQENALSDDKNYRTKLITKTEYYEEL